MVQDKSQTNIIYCLAKSSVILNYSNPDFKSMPVFDSEYISNGAI